MLHMSHVCKRHVGMSCRSQGADYILGNGSDKILLTGSFKSVRPQHKQRPSSRRSRVLALLRALSGRQIIALAGPAVFETRIQGSSAARWVQPGLDVDVYRRHFAASISAITSGVSTTITSHIIHVRRVWGLEHRTPIG